MRHRVLQGDVFDVLPTLAPESVDSVVTSPPYWNLRRYLPPGHPLASRELGGEPTPGEYVANQVRVLRLVRDALADHGTVWLNVGDTYTSTGGRTQLGASSQRKGRSNIDAQLAVKGAEVEGLAEGNLCLVPQRLAIALQDDGWFVRSVVVWHKPAPMPASLSGWQWRRCRVKVGGQKRRTHTPEVDSGHRRESNIQADFQADWADCPGCKKCKANGGLVLRRGSWRPTSSWEPVLMLAKSDRYYADGEAVKQPAAAATIARDQYSRVLDDPDEQYGVKHDHETESDGGANLRDVWSIGPEPLLAGWCPACGDQFENVSALRGRRCPCGERAKKHYAAFPTELARRCLMAGTSQRGYCPACGSPWCRVVTRKSMVVNRSGWADESGNRTAPGGAMLEPAECETLDWRPSCDCPPAEPRPGLVLDPFAGSGRTGRAAMGLGLDFVGIELNPEYAVLARRLVADGAGLFGEECHDCD